MNGPHAKLAADTWRMICAVAELPEGEVPELDAAAKRFIEMACDAALEASREAEEDLVCASCGDPNRVKMGAL